MLCCDTSARQQYHLNIAIASTWNALPCIGITKWDLPVTGCTPVINTGCHWSGAIDPYLFIIRRISFSPYLRKILRAIRLTKWEALRLSLMRLYRIIRLWLRNTRRCRLVLSAVERHRASHDTDTAGFSTTLEKCRKLWRQNDHVRRDICAPNAK